MPSKECKEVCQILTLALSIGEDQVRRNAATQQTSTKTVSGHAPVGTS